MEKIKILMLEDVKDDVDIIERVLHKGGISFVSLQVDTREEFIQGIKEFKPDVILSDHALPQFNSIEAHKICLEHKLFIPFILVTGTVSEEFAVTCLKLGVDDYVLKSNLSRLPAAILNALKQRRLEKLKRIAAKALKDQNHHISKINKELDSFIYSISHSLRGPVSTTMGLLNLAEYENLHENNTSKHLHTLMRSCMQKLDVTLGQMLEYSRNARLDIEIQEVNFIAILEKCFESLSYMPDASKIHKEIHYITKEPFYSDTFRLEVIFNSILSNAIKYLDLKKEKPSITVQIICSAESASLTFEDNGIGIPDKYLHNIYDMFFRASEKSDGAGLGLYITKEFIEKLNGRIDISSKESEGTTVVITLPNMNPYKKSKRTINY